MTTIEPIIPGLYARSEDLVQATRDHDRDRIDDGTLHEAQRRDAEALIGVQVDAGYTTVATGQLTWQDPFRPFTSLIDNLDPDTLVRFLDTNTFYRRPDIDGEPELATGAIGEFLDTWLPTPGQLDTLATLPSPTAFVTGAADEDHTYPPPTIATTLATELYPELITQAGQRGITTVTLYDPWLADIVQPDAFIQALDDLAQAVPDDGPELLLQLPFIDAEPLLGHVLGTELDGLIVDLTLTDRAALAAVPTETTLGLGVADARSSIVERSDRIVATAASVIEATDPERVLLAPTGDLQHVPETIARQKVRALGEAATTLSDKLGGDA